MHLPRLYKIDQQRAVSDKLSRKRHDKRMELKARCAKTVDKADECAEGNNYQIVDTIVIESPIKDS